MENALRIAVLLLKAYREADLGFDVEGRGLSKRDHQLRDELDDLIELLESDQKKSAPRAPCRAMGAFLSGKTSQCVGPRGHEGDHRYPCSSTDMQLIRAQGQRLRHLEAELQAAIEMGFSMGAVVEEKE